MNKETINFFSDLFRSDDGGDGLGATVEKGDVLGNVSIPDATDLLLKSHERARFGLPEASALETRPHKDGTEIEKDGSAVWTNTYKGGELVKAMVVDPKLPDMFFDHRGREISRDAYQAIDDSGAPIFVSEHIAKILGISDLSAESLQK
jgi:hypothetical protein